MLIVDLAGCSFLVPSKDEVNVSGAALFISETTLLRQLSKRLAIHFSTIGVRAEDLLEVSSGCTLGLRCGTTSTSRTYATGLLLTFLGRFLFFFT